jgi:protease I
MAGLSELRVAALTTHGVEEVELTDTVAALREAGARVDIYSPDGGEVQAMRYDEKSIRIPTSGKINSVEPEQFDAVLLPGGAFNADILRMDEDARRFVHSMQQRGLPIAAICHAPWLLVSAELVEGRTLTSYYTLQDDIRNAGGNWIDKEVVVNGNLITSRQPQDIAAFNEAMIREFGRVPELRRART